MKNKYFKGNEGHYIFCDICGQACYAAEAIRLEKHTGRGGLVVCPEDADAIDPGLISYKVPVEQSVKVSRVNHTNLSNGSEPVNIETSTDLGV